MNKTKKTIKHIMDSIDVDVELEIDNKVWIGVYEPIGDIITFTEYDIEQTVKGN